MTDLFILDEDEFYLKSVVEHAESKGLKVVGSSDWSTAIDDLKELAPKVVVLQRKSGSMRKSLVVQMSEELLMDKSRIFLSNDLAMDEMDTILAQSLGFERILSRPLVDFDLCDMFPDQFEQSFEEISKDKKAA